MKRIPLFLIMLPLFFIFLPVFAGTLPTGTKIFKKPSFKSKVLKILDKDVKTKIQKTGVINWYRVVVYGVRGYVHIGASAGGSASGRGSSREDSKAPRGGGTDLRGGRGGASGAHADMGRAGARGAGRARGGSSTMQETSRGQSAAGASASRPGSGRKISKAERLAAEHQAAQEAALRQGENFCSQCWYAKKGVDHGRQKNTNPQIAEDGSLMQSGVSVETEGKEIVK